MRIDLDPEFAVLIVHQQSRLADDVGMRVSNLEVVDEAGLCTCGLWVDGDRLVRGKPEVTTAAQVTARSLGWGEARWGKAGGTARLK